MDGECSSMIPIMHWDTIRYSTDEAIRSAMCRNYSAILGFLMTEGWDSILKNIIKDAIKYWIFVAAGSKEVAYLGFCSGGNRKAR